MRIGILDIDTRSPREAIANCQLAAEEGFDRYWIPGGWRDPLTLLTVAGQHNQDIALGSAIVSIYGGHPTALAEQALTVNAAVGGRLALGLGASHRHMVEQRFGESFDQPIRRLREHLTILRSLFDTGAVEFTGETLSAHTEIRITGAPSPQILVAALSEQSLRVAGRLADGTVTNFIGPKLLADHTVPTITAAAEQAGRPQPRVVASMPICVTDDEDAGREAAAEQYAVYVTRYTAYRSAFERQGVDGPAALAVVGDEDAVAKELDRFADAGAVEFCAHPFGTEQQQARTRRLLASLAADRRESPAQ